MDEIDYKHRLYWDQSAARYDARVIIQGFMAPQILVPLTIPFLQGRKRILDAACGTGGVGKVLDDFLEEKKPVIDGFDFSPEMLKYAKFHENYRNLTQADLTDQDQLKGIVKKVTPYNNIICVGAYGDAVAETEVTKLEAVMSHKSPVTIAIAGERSGLTNIGQILGGMGFDIKNDLEASGYSFKMDSVLYRYIVGVRDVVKKSD